MCVQENPLMHNGHPCEELYPDEYFEEGITNGAQWYNVPGKPTFFSPSFVPHHIHFVFHRRITEAYRDFQFFAL